MIFFYQRLIRVFIGSAERLSVSQNTFRGINIAFYRLRKQPKIFRNRLDSISAVCEFTATQNFNPKLVKFQSATIQKKIYENPILNSPRSMEVDQHEEIPSGLQFRVEISLKRRKTKEKRERSVTME